MFQMKLWGLYTVFVITKFPRINSTIPVWFVDKRGSEKLRYMTQVSQVDITVTLLDPRPSTLLPPSSCLTGRCPLFNSLIPEFLVLSSLKSWVCTTACWRKHGVPTGSRTQLACLQPLHSSPWHWQLPEWSAHCPRASLTFTTPHSYTSQCLTNNLLCWWECK